MQTNANDKLTFWKRKLQEYRKSGLSREDFSRQIGFNKSTLDYCFVRISKEKKTRGLVEIKPTSVAILNLPLNVVVADKIIVLFIIRASHANSECGDHRVIEATLPLILGHAKQIP